MEMDAVNYIVVGFGLNVNTPLADFPKELKEKATSIFIETGEQLSRIKLVRACLEQFEKYYNMFKENEFSPIMERWKQLSDIIGKKIMVDVVGQKHQGEVVDIDDDGVLILEDGQGRRQRIFSGDVTLC
jgi:BirA family biotin operon repressor/biotin-[acetyl-CoA-carboxylase] ligase